jgi:hypothetical protein
MGERASTEELQELERRVAAFTSATQRLTSTLATDPPPRPAPGEETPAPAPSAVHDEPISGLRPAVATDLPATGALTARRRSEGGTSFTSAHGRPHLDVQPAAPPSHRLAAPRRRWQWWHAALAVGGAALLVMALVVVTSRFPVLPEASVVANTITITAPGHGVLAAVLRPIHATVRQGEPLLTWAPPPGSAGEPRPLTSPADGQVVGLHLSAGRQAMPGEPLVDLALPGTARVVARLPESLVGRIARGDRCEIRLIGENAVVGGTVDAVLAGGETLPGLAAAGHPRLVVALDPAPTAPQPGLGARVAVLGPNPGLLRQMAYRLRQLGP